MKRRRLAVALAAGFVAAAGACTPDVGSSRIPTAMQFDLTTAPPRAPQPTALIVNPQTGLIDFSLAGTPIPADCSTQTALTPAQCQFDQWLQTLDGFPSLTTASAPASGPLDRTTLTLGTNVDVFACDPKAAGGCAANGAPVTSGLAVDFDPTSNSLTVTPPGPWTLGELYWMGVRGYANGIRDTAGAPVVGSPTMALLREDSPLTCGATDPSQVKPDCAGYQVVAQGNPMPTPTAAAMQLFQLEAIRLAYLGGGGFDAMTASGLPKDELAVLWGFPIHTNSVPLLLPGTAAVPVVPAANQIVVGVQGPVDAATVSAFVAKVQSGPVVVMDLTAAAAGDLDAGFPPLGAAYLPTPGAALPGAIAIQFAAPFPAGHEIGLFFTNAIHSPDGAPLVASPVSVLLRLTAPLVDSAGHSTVSGVGDTDAAVLEAGRQALAPLFDNPIFTPLTGVTRANLVYCYAFVPTVMP
ncbi:MAG TPA: hypothetical protein VGP64_14950 [Polyangia bacterium]|jgi:hypothetical protein